MKNKNLVIAFENVKKSYKIPSFLKSVRKVALNNVSFEIYEQEFVGLIGLNGAGKTTIIKLICGILKKDFGNIKVFGKDIDSNDISYKTRIGYLPEIPYFYPYIKAYDILKFYYSISGISIDNKRISVILDKVGLNGKEKEKVKNLSKGMMQKLAIACAMIHNPDILILDEPTSGLDPISIKDVRDILLNYNLEGKTIFLSSHSISELEKVCNRVIIIDKGEIKKVIEKNEWQERGLENIFIETVSYENQNN